MKAELAEQYFRAGYSCSQAVLLAFHADIGISESMAAKMASSFGGGMGRMREVCGAVSGMLMAAGLLFGYDDPDNRQAKIDHYAAVRQLAGQFTEKNATLYCRELLKDCPTTPGGIPQERNEAFYQSRPCLRLIREAAEILENFVGSA